MKIFLSYSSADREQAEQICLALEAQGHEVFFDREDLQGGEDFNAVIRKQVADARMLVFLISPASVRDGAYSLSELRFAREKWNHPGRHVLPVMLKPTPLKDVPVYLKSVTILQPEGNAAAEVAARIAARKPARRYLFAALAVIVIAAGAIGLHLFGGAVATPWHSSIEASDFITGEVYRSELVERSDYSLDPTFDITGPADSVVYVTRIAYGSIRDTAAAMSITIRFRNVTSTPQPMDFTHRFFSLDDDQGRKATLLYFCCVPGPELLPVGGEREMQLIFAANPGWSGKEVQAHRINFRVKGLLPLASGVWSVPALATAASP